MAVFADFEVSSSDPYLRHFDPGAVIFAQGEAGDAFFIVLSGAVGIFKRDAEGTRLLHQLGAGKIFGEMAVINSVPRAAEARALDDGATVLAVDRARFLYLVSQQPGFALFVMETLAHWIRPAADADSPTELLGRGARPDLACTPVQVCDNVWQLRSRVRSCNSFLFRGRDHVALIDPGLPSNFDALAAALASLGAPAETIDTIILTHEHFDHVAATPLFSGRRRVFAHPLAAHKLATGDEFAIMSGSFGEPGRPFAIDRDLREGQPIDLGGMTLAPVHTPGHTSGCVCLFEPAQGLVVTGDMALAGGHFGGVFGSGNISDSIHSLSRLEALGARKNLPGHGPVSEDPGADFRRAAQKCRALLRDSRRIFETLNAQESINKLMLAVRDLNR